MKVAVEGCCHGELDKIYETIAYLEQQSGVKVDLLLCCGDFQAVRNPSDMNAMAVPPKFQKMNTFYKYYSGEKKAPILTVFIGGNHEASNYLQEMAYGGWVAKNIYYLGYAGVVQIGGVRIGGVSGIYKSQDYLKGRHEHLPYTESTKRSVYHTRNIDIFRLKQVKLPIDVMLSHDWPEGVYNHGNRQQLAKFKPYFADDMANGCLGSPPSAELMFELKPNYWFAAHLHAKFAALVQHDCEDGSNKETRFLALDKCLPKRRFLQLLDIPHDETIGLKLKLDPEWLCILKATNHLMKMTKANVYMPGPGGPRDERIDYSVSEDEIKNLKEDFGGDLTIPENFERTAEKYHVSHGSPNSLRRDPQIHINPQTTLLCEMLGITDPATHFTQEKPVLNVTVEETGKGSDSGSASDSGDTESLSDDSFIVSRDQSSLGLSSCKLLDETMDEKYVTASENLSKSTLSTDISLSSSTRGLPSPPLTSGEEHVYEEESSLCINSDDSPKRKLQSEDTIQLLTSTPKTDTAPRTPPNEKLDCSGSHLLTSTPKPNTAAGTPPSKELNSSGSQPKKFKRRNQSFYASTE